MMRTRQTPIYRLLNRDYHESFDFYVPQHSDFYDLVSSKLPAGWEIKRNGIWFHCRFPHDITPEQGWKIHVSATRANAQEILDRVSSVLLANGGENFKFALDIPTLFLLNGKNWPRGSSGKFITIYPQDNRRFLELIEQINLATREFHGPYILSDHRYKDSNVVFYRYGGIRLRESLDVTGERTPVLVTPDGTEVPDWRMAHPSTPAWAETLLPCQEHEGTSEDSFLLCQGRFQIEGVIDFSSAGGVYRGTDTWTGAPVVIKEARPCIETSDGNDAVALLKKEYRLLMLLADTGIAPRPVELFEEGTHWFLVEEHIKGCSLNADSSLHNVLLRTRPADHDFQVWYQKFRKIALRLTEIVKIIHSRNVVYSDLSPNNLIVTEEGNDLKLIDFEGAYQLGVDKPTNLYTPGFVSQSRLEGAVAGPEDDYYAVGAVLMSYLLPINGLFHLKQEAKAEFMLSIQRDARLPMSAAKMILNLLDSDTSRRPAAEAIAEMLPPTCVVETEEPPAPVPNYDYASVLNSIVQHILQVATYNRPDRLFPADPKLFATNPLNLAHGACGIAYALKKITGEVPQPIIDWILAHPVSCDTYAPGLYMGLSGVAWTLLEIGERTRAERVLQLTFEHPLLCRSVDLFYGRAGWGMTNLDFFLKTGNELYLDKAKECGNWLLEKNSAGYLERIWSQPDRPLGLAHGISGVALYLLYLYLVTGEERFIAAGRKALAIELAAGIETLDGGLAWGSGVDSQSVLYPYWRYGSAGIGSVVARYYHVLGQDTYRHSLEKIFIETDREYAVLPGRFIGLAGIGDFLLDAWSVTGEQKYLDSARKVARGVMKFSVNRNGAAFPGDFLNRLCCDYGTGSAGIALFLNRLMARQGADFVLADLLDLRAGQVSDLSPVQCEKLPSSTHGPRLWRRSVGIARLDKL